MKKSERHEECERWLNTRDTKRENNTKITTIQVVLKRNDDLS